MLLLFLRFATLVCGACNGVVAMESSAMVSGSIQVMKVDGVDGLEILVAVCASGENKKSMVPPSQLAALFTSCFFGWNDGRSCVCSRLFTEPIGNECLNGFGLPAFRPSTSRVYACLYLRTRGNSTISRANAGTLC